MFWKDYQPYSFVRYDDNASNEIGNLQDTRRYPFLPSLAQARSQHLSQTRRLHRRASTSSNNENDDQHVLRAETTRRLGSTLSCPTASSFRRHTADTSMSSPATLMSAALYSRTRSLANVETTTVPPMWFGLQPGIAVLQCCDHLGRLHHDWECSCGYINTNGMPQLPLNEAENAIADQAAGPIAEGQQSTAIRRTRCAPLYSF